MPGPLCTSRKNTGLDVQRCSATDCMICSVLQDPALLWASVRHCSVEIRTEQWFSTPAAHQNHSGELYKLPVSWAQPQPD